MKRKSILLGSLFIISVFIASAMIVTAHHIPEGSDELGFIVDHWYNGSIVGSGIFTVSSNMNFGSLNVTNISMLKADSLETSAIRVPSCTLGQALISATGTGDLICMDIASLVTKETNLTAEFPGMDTNVTVPSDVLTRNVMGSFDMSSGITTARSLNIQVNCGSGWTTVQRIRMGGSVEGAIGTAFSFSVSGGCTYRFANDETGGSMSNTAYAFADTKL